MPERGDSQAEFRPIDDTLKLIDGILALTDESHKTGEALQLSITVAQSEALKTQLENLKQSAITPEKRSHAAKKLSEFSGKYHELPEDVKQSLATAMFELFPETGTKPM